MTATAGNFTASSYLVFGVYNAEYRYFNGDTCRNGTQQNFNQATIGIR